MQMRLPSASSLLLPNEQPESSLHKPDIETSSADYASRFAGRAGRYLLDVQARSIEAVLQGLEPGTVLDVGGGHGQLVKLLERRGWRPTVHGTDSVCETNLRNLHNETACPFVQGSLTALPAADRSFDLVIAVRLVSHMPAWPALLAEMCRVARRAVIIDYPSKLALNALTPLLFSLKKSLEGNTRTYLSFAGAELERELAAHGFRVARRHKQFFLPMVVHRLGRSAAPLRMAERVFRAVGLTALGGSPVILRVDRERGA